MKKIFFLWNLFVCLSVFADNNENCSYLNFERNGKKSLIISSAEFKDIKGLIGQDSFVVDPVTLDSKYVRSWSLKKYVEDRCNIHDFDQVIILAKNVKIKYGNRIDFRQKENDEKKVEVLIITDFFEIEKNVNFQGVSGINVYSTQFTDELVRNSTVGTSLEVKAGKEIKKYLTDLASSIEYYNDEDDNYCTWNCLLLSAFKDQIPLEVKERSYDIAEHIVKNEDIKNLHLAKEILDAIVEFSNKKDVKILKESQALGEEELTDWKSYLKNQKSRVEISDENRVLTQSLVLAYNMSAGLDHKANSSNFINKNQVELFFDSCDSLDLEFELYDLGYEYRSNLQFIPKNIFFKHAQKCSYFKSYMIPSHIAFDHPEKSLQTLFSEFERFLTEYEKLKREVEVSESKRQDSDSERVHYKITEADYDLYIAQAEIEAKIIKEKLSSIDIEFKKKYERLAHLHVQLSGEKEYEELVYDLPDNLPKTSAGQEFLGFLSAAGGGAAAGAAGGPVGAIIGGVVGAIGFIGNKDKERKNRELQEKIMRIKKKLQLLRVDMRIKERAHQVFLTIESIGQLRIEQRVMLLNYDKISLIIATNLKKKELVRSQKSADELDSQEVVISRGESLNEDRKYMNELIKQIRNKFQYIFAMPIEKVLELSGGRDVCNFDGNNQSLLYRDCFLQLIRIKSNTKDYAQSIGLKNMSFNMPKLKGYVRKSFLKVVELSSQKNKELYHQLLNKNLFSFDMNVIEEGSVTRNFSIRKDMKNTKVENFDIFFDYKNSENCRDPEEEDYVYPFKFVVDFGPVEYFESTKNTKMYFSTKRSKKGFDLSGYSRERLFEESPEVDLYGLRTLRDYREYKNFMINSGRFLFVDQRLINRSPLTTWKVKLKKKGTSSFTTDCVKELKLVFLISYITE